MKIGSHSLSLPLIQGGMGVGVSLSSLAGNVAKKGAMGVISTAQIGFKKPSFLKDTKKANVLKRFQIITVWWQSMSWLP